MACLASQRLQTTRPPNPRVQEVHQQVYDAWLVVLAASGLQQLLYARGIGNGRCCCSCALPCSCSSSWATACCSHAGTSQTAWPLYEKQEGSRGDEVDRRFAMQMLRVGEERVAESAPGASARGACPRAAGVSDALRLFHMRMLDSLTRSVCSCPFEAVLRWSRLLRMCSVASVFVHSTPCRLSRATL